MWSPGIRFFVTVLKVCHTLTQNKKMPLSGIFSEVKVEVCLFSHRYFAPCALINGPSG